MNNNNSINSIKELLNAAVNKNQVTFSHVAKIAENVGSGLLKVKLNESGKSVDFEYMNKKISIDLNRFRINGVKYLNDLFVDDIMTKDDLAQFEELIKQIREEINKKADIEHTHDLTEVYTEFQKHYNDIYAHLNPLEAEIADYNARLNQTESTLQLVEDKTQMMTSTANELTINTNGGYPLRIYGTTNYTRLVLGNNETNCLYLGYNKPLNLAYLKTNGGGELKVTATDLECSNLNLKVSGTISSPTITYLENSITDIKTDILKSIYPVGSIYTSMTSTNPATLFGFGTWTQIKDRFLYCTTSSKSTGGSKKITIENLPAHTHNSVVAPDINGNPDGSADSSTGTSLGQSYWRGNKGKTLDGGNVATSSTGSGSDYMPPYISCFAWYREK